MHSALEILSTSMDISQNGHVSKVNIHGLFVVCKILAKSVHVCRGVVRTIKRGVGDRGWDNLYFRAAIEVCIKNEQKNL